MNKLTWTKAYSNNYGHHEMLEADSKQGSVTLAYVGRYTDSKDFQASEQGSLSDVLNTRKNFSSIKECKQYVETEINSFMRELLNE